MGTPQCINEEQADSSPAAEARHQRSEARHQRRVTRGASPEEFRTEIQGHTHSVIY